MKKKLLIISGGQTGVDLIAQRLAYAHGFRTGGYATNDYMTEYGTNRNESIRHGMVPIQYNGSLTEQYRRRNEMNIKLSNLCIVFSLIRSKGTELSKQYISKHKKDSIIISDLDNVDTYGIAEYIKEEMKNKIEYVINFIGHRESKLEYEQAIRISDIIQDILCQLE